jgi:hypothetical protein
MTAQPLAGRLAQQGEQRVATGSSGMRRRQEQATKERRKREIFTFPQTRRNTKGRAGVVGKEEEERARQQDKKGRRKKKKKKTR